MDSNIRVPPAGWTIRPALVLLMALGLIVFFGYEAWAHQDLFLRICGAFLAALVLADAIYFLFFFLKTRNTDLLTLIPYKTWQTGIGAEVPVQLNHGLGKSALSSSISLLDGFGQKLPVEQRESQLISNFKRRTYQEMVCWSLEIKSPMGFIRFKKWFPLERLRVFPQTQSFPSLNFSSIAGDDEAGISGLEREGDLLDTKVYSVGDSSRRILWKIVAKTAGRLILSRKPEIEMRSANTPRCAVWFEVSQEDAKIEGYVETLLARDLALWDCKVRYSTSNTWVEGNLSRALEVLCESASHEVHKVPTESHWEEFCEQCTKESRTAILIHGQPSFPRPLKKLKQAWLCYPEAGPNKLGCRLVHDEG